MTREEEIQEIWEEKYKHLPQGCSDKLTLEEICYTFFEFGWLAADKNQIGNARNWMSKCATLQQEVDALNEKLANVSIIKWQEETPCEECLCLVTLDDGSVHFDLFTQDEVYCGNEVWGWANNLIADVIAWCKLSDIQPYKDKEETK